MSDNPNHPIVELLQLTRTSDLPEILLKLNEISIFEFVDKMNRKGRIMNYAFATSAAFVFGDHMAFILAISATEKLSSKYLIAVIVSKLVGGITAIIVTQLMYKKLTKNDTSEITN